MGQGPSLLCAHLCMWRSQSLPEELDPWSEGLCVEGQHLEGGSMSLMNRHTPARAVSTNCKAVMVGKWARRCGA